MKNGKKYERANNGLFPDLHITISSQLNGANKAGNLNKMNAAKKILAKVKFPSSLGAETSY